MSSDCQRAILSCSRCRRRKLKCDRKLPACTRCVATKTTCTGISSSSAADVPRSIVQHLESEIARLETELMENGHLEALNASNILMQMPSSTERLDRNGIEPSEELQTSHGASSQLTDKGDLNHDTRLRTSILSSKCLRAIVDATLPHGSGATALLSRVRMGMTPSFAQVGDNRAAPTNPETSKRGILLDAKTLRSVPLDIVFRLMKKYLNTILPDNPFLDAATVEQQFHNVAEVLKWQVQSQTAGEEPLPVIASHDFLIVYLVLAISVTLGSANDGHEERCMALSASLFDEGIQHLYSEPSFPSDISWLQTILLVLLYATVFPRSANVWVLSGVAMRSCLELGLHREAPSYMGLNPSALESRRRVFWAAYCMDRSICPVLQRPLSTPDAAINCKLPALARDDAFLTSIVYHRLLSEIFHVHFQREPIAPGMAWDAWLTTMENRLHSWHNSCGQDSSHHESTEFGLARSIMILHRPSPRVPLPSQNSLLCAFEAASKSARIHQEHIEAGFFRRPWLSAHYTLEAATTVLFCLRHASETIRQNFSRSQVFDMTKRFTSNFLAIADRGWPVVSNYASVYERLLGPLLERVFSQVASLSDRFGPAQDLELMRLVYPGPAQLEKLRFGLRQQSEEFSPFDFNLFMVDDDLWNDGLDLNTDITTMERPILGLNAISQSAMGFELTF